MPAKNMVYMLLTAAIFLDSLLYGLIVPIVPYYARELRADPGLLGIIFAMYSLALLLGSFPAGYACDRLGRRPVLLAGLFMLFVSTLSFAWVNNMWLLVLSRFFQGMAGAAIWTAGLAAAAAMFPGEERGGRLGLMLSFIGLGTILGPLFSGFLLSIWGYRAPFFSTALLILPPALAFLWIRLPEPEQPGAGGDAGIFMFFKSLGDPAISLVMLLIVAASYGIGMLEPLLPLRLSRDFGLDSRGIGIIFGVMGLAYSLIQPVWGYLSDRAGHRPVMLLGLAAAAFVAPALALVPGLVYMYVAVCLFSFAASAMLTPCLPLLAEYSEKSGGEAYGKNFGLVNAAYSVGLLAGPAAGGVMAQYFSFLGAIGFYSVLLIIIGAGMLLARTGVRAK
ncbi:tetracycline efflux protein TetA [Desulfocucumis palustris]|uniref:Tetracycline efflux protein TetA n=1 Tax=Desulfocucumis palustris TaxID=1898651 RepID=A0A2L2XBW5_9FIRM|nr:MFS transporter [Desulfocucumis palustris]GBF33582.1 tetracycline efflux protein TetA [Desulfocucumis palustris]